MASHLRIVGSGRRHLRQQAERWFIPAARAGYAARGLIYSVIGYFAALAAIGAGAPMGSQQALDELLGSSAGGVLAYVLIVGLVFYAIWRLIQAGFDTDQHGTSLKGLAIRAGLLASAAVYAMLAVYAFSLRHGRSQADGGGFAESLAGFVGNRWAALALAVIFAAVGFAHVVKAVRERYSRYIEAGPRAMRFIHPVAKSGLIARGAVFLVVALLFAIRAWRAGAGGQAPNSRTALEYIQSLPGGGWLLAATGLGLIAFALYSFAEAAFRRIDAGS